MAAKAKKKKAAAKPRKKAAVKRKAAKPKKKAAAKRRAAKPKKKAAAKRKAAKPKKKAAAKRKAAKPKKKAAKLALKRVILQFTRNGRNLGRPQLAPRGADDIHFVWRNPPGVFVRAWWTRGGRRIKAIRVPRYANDVHVRIR